MQQVHFKFDKKSGGITIEGEGFVGNSCEVLKQVEASLGTIVATELKPEAFLDDNVVQNVNA